MTERTEGGRAIERKVITALFCDVVGSTELGEQLDPEDIDGIMGSYHRLARRRIEANGGAVEKFIGDAVVGVFGAPAVHEDDPARAVRAALAIIGELAASGLGLQVRIGIHTGEAVVRVGDDRSAEEGFASGDILNTAARLQNAAPAGGIAAGEPTYRLTAGEFDWQDLGEVELKGKAQPVHVWRPLQARRESTETAESTPFLGRDADLTALVRAFERSASGPKVELVTIVAEPGMGKSRLVRELGRQLLAKGNVTWRKGRSLPYGEGVSFWALGEIVKAHAGILETDDEATVSAKLDAAITEPDPAIHSWFHSRLAPLVGLHTDAAAPTQEEQFSAWTRFLTSLAADDPLVLVFEDLHWADQALVAFLIHLADVTDKVPLLLITTARPEVSERHPDWLVRAARSTIIQLVSLGDDAIHALVESTLAGASDALIATVLERAAGSPLYAEQLAALARERGWSGQDGEFDESAIPPTIQALLAARIDALPRELKPALLDASVVGRVFWSGAVASLEGEEGPTIDPALLELARRELTREQTPSTMAGEAEYSFWHALLRDVAYSFLPRAARLAKHRAAAAWITDRAGGSLGDLAEIVVDHLRHALDLATATGAEDDVPDIRSDLASALIAAADHTMRIEPTRSIDQLRSALDLLQADDARRPDTLTALGRALSARAQYAEAVPIFEAAVAAHRALGNDLAAAGLSIQYAWSLRRAGDTAKGNAVIANVRPLLEAHPGPGLVELHLYDAAIAERAIDFQARVGAADAALALAEQLGLPRPYRALTERGVARIEEHDPDGEADLREGLDLALAAGDNRHALIALSSGAFARERLSDSLAAFDEAIAFAARYGLADDNVRALRLDSLETAGRWDEALADVPALLTVAIDRGDAYTALMVRMVRGAIEVARGQVTEPVDNMMAEGVAAGFGPSVPSSVVVRDAFARGDQATARRRMLEALESVEGGGFITGAPALVDVAVGMGDIGLARQVLAKAWPGLSDGGMSGMTELATGLVLEAEGDFAGALGRFEASHEYFNERGWVQSDADSLAGMGRSRIALGDIDTGLDLLRRAREIAVFLKAPPMISGIDSAILAAST